MSEPDKIIELAPGEHPPVPGAVKIASTDYAQAHHSTRTKARKQALDVLFQADLRRETVSEVLARRTAQGEPQIREFTRGIVEGYQDNARAIDRRIDQALSGDWTIWRMPRVDRNLARIAVWEMDYTPIAAKIAMSEAMELANELSTDDSVSFLNGMLGRIMDTARRERDDQPVDDADNPDSAEGIESAEIDEPESTDV